MQKTCECQIIVFKYKHFVVEHIVNIMIKYRRYSMNWRGDMIRITSQDMCTCVQKLKINYTISSSQDRYIHFPYDPFVANKNIIYSFIIFVKISVINIIGHYLRIIRVKTHLFNWRNKKNYPFLMLVTCEWMRLWL